MKILFIAILVILFVYQIVKFFTRRAIIRAFELHQRMKNEQEPPQSPKSSSRNNVNKSQKKDFGGGDYVEYEEIK